MEILDFPDGIQMEHAISEHKGPAHLDRCFHLSWLIRPWVEGGKINPKHIVRSPTPYADEDDKGVICPT